jgi:predicted transcriptional regulator
MTRIYALERLLEHGPLTISQLIDITRWPRNTLVGTLRRLRDDRIVTVDSGNVYRLAE